MIGDGPGKLESLIADISVFDRAKRPETRGNWPAIVR